MSCGTAISPCAERYLHCRAKYREALLLFYFHEMDVPAAAQSLGLPEGTVKARLHRGRELLRAKLPRLLALTPEGVV